MAGSIGAQGNTRPVYRKPINKSEDYWGNRALEENKKTRGAPESPYAPRYNNDSRSNTKALSEAPQKTNTLELMTALQGLSDATLAWTTTPSNKAETCKGIIKLEGESVTIEYTYDTNSGINNLKWGNKEIIKDGEIKYKVTEETKSHMLYGLLEGLETAYKYRHDDMTPMNFLDLKKLEQRELDRLTTKIFGDGAYVFKNSTQNSRRRPPRF
jgi:hypothetical protein